MRRIRLIAALVCLAAILGGAIVLALLSRGGTVRPAGGGNDARNASAFRVRANTACSMANTKVMALGHVPVIDSSHRASAAAFLAAEAGSIEGGVAAAMKASASAHDRPAVARLWRDALALAGAVRDEAQALSSGTEAEYVSARGRAEALWLRTSDEASVLGVEPCGWLVH